MRSDAFMEQQHSGTRAHYLHASSLLASSSAAPRGHGGGGYVVAHTRSNVSPPRLNKGLSNGKSAGGGIPGLPTMTTRDRKRMRPANANTSATTAGSSAASGAARASASTAAETVLRGASSLFDQVDSPSASETPSEDLDVFLPPASVAAAQARRNAKQQQQQQQRRHAQQLKYNNAHVLIATSPERVHQRGRQPVIGVDVSERAGKSPPPPVTQARPRMTTMRATEAWAQATTPAGKHVSSKFTGVHTPAAAHSTLNQRPVHPPSGNGVNALAAAAAAALNRPVPPRRWSNSPTGVNHANGTGSLQAADVRAASLSPPVTLHQHSATKSVKSADEMNVHSPSSSLSSDRENQLAAELALSERTRIIAECALGTASKVVAGNPEVKEDAAKIRVAVESAAEELRKCRSARKKYEASMHAALHAESNQPQSQSPPPQQQHPQQQKKEPTVSMRTPAQKRQESSAPPMEFPAPAPATVARSSRPKPATSDPVPATPLPTRAACNGAVPPTPMTAKSDAKSKAFAARLSPETSPMKSPMLSPSMSPTTAAAAAAAAGASGPDSHWIRALSDAHAAQLRRERAAFDARGAEFAEQLLQVSRRCDEAIAKRRDAEERRAAAERSSAVASSEVVRERKVRDEALRRAKALETEKGALEVQVRMLKEAMDHVAANGSGSPSSDRTSPTAASAAARVANPLLSPRLMERAIHRLSGEGAPGNDASSPDRERQLLATWRARCASAEAKAATLSGRVIALTSELADTRAASEDAQARMASVTIARSALALAVRDEELTAAHRDDIHAVEMRWRRIMEEEQSACADMIHDLSAEVFTTVDTASAQITTIGDEVREDLTSLRLLFAQARHDAYRQSLRNILEIASSAAREGRQIGELIGGALSADGKKSGSRKSLKRRDIIARNFRAIIMSFFKLLRYPTFFLPSAESAHALNATRRFALIALAAASMHAMGQLAALRFLPTS